MKLSTSPVVWIIDRQHWPRAWLRAELMERGFDAVGYITIAHALISLYHYRERKPCIIVVELNEQDITRLELEALTHIGVPIIVLGGAAELNQDIIREFKCTVIMQRPFTIGEVADMVEEVFRSQQIKPDGY